MVVACGVAIALFGMIEADQSATRLCMKVVTASICVKVAATIW